MDDTQSEEGSFIQFQVLTSYKCSGPKIYLKLSDLRGRRRGGRGGGANAPPLFKVRGLSPPHFFTSLLVKLCLSA